MAKRFSKAVRMQRLRTKRAAQAKLVSHLRGEWAKATRKLDRAVRSLAAMDGKVLEEESKCK